MRFRNAHWCYISDFVPIKYFLSCIKPNRIYQICEAKQMIEEFMLSVNVSADEKIFEALHLMFGTHCSFFFTLPYSRSG